MALQLGALNAGYGERFLELRAHMDEQFAQVDRRFAELRAHTDQRFAQVDQRFAELRARTDQRFAQVDQRFTAMDGRIKLLNWMVGSFGTVIVGFVAAVFVKLFVH